MLDFQQGGGGRSSIIPWSWRDWMCPLGLASSGGQATQCKGHTLTRSRLQAAPELDPASSSHTQTPPPPASLRAQAPQ